MTLTERSTTFALCVNNAGYAAASLELRKIYRIIPDPKAEVHSLIRVVDESGEDYLYPTSFFVPIEVPSDAVRVFETAS